MTKPDESEEEEPLPPTLLGSASALPMRLVCVEGRTVADAVVVVSPSDPNWYRHGYDDNGVVTVITPATKAAAAAELHEILRKRGLR